MLGTEEEVSQAHQTAGDGNGDDMHTACSDRKDTLLWQKFKVQPNMRLKGLCLFQDQGFPRLTAPGSGSPGGLYEACCTAAHVLI